MKTPGFFGLAFIFLTLLFTVTGQLLVKHGMRSMGPAPTELFKLPSYILQAMLSPFVAGSFVCAALAALCWMAAVSRCDLSFAYPFMGLAIVLTLALTPLFFGERVQLHQWTGVALVVAGVWLASRGE
ncbi:MAG: EamA family transporter [Opitutaceae bacterium]|nr:EamA family transporter [Opitutaceae bacterium]